MGAVASVDEVRAAQSFLQQLGANFADNYLIIAVVSWFRQESGSLAAVIGNNPFNIRPSASDAPFRNGQRYYPGNGYFSTYATIELGFEAAANMLVHGQNDWRGYGAIVAAARADKPIDFLMAIAYSAWDIAHYGVRGRDPATNSLVRLYATFTGLNLPSQSGGLQGHPPGKPAKQPPQHPPSKPPDKPAEVFRPFRPASPLLEPTYIQPYEAKAFYNVRHEHPVLPLKE